MGGIHSVLEQSEAGRITKHSLTTEGAVLSGVGRPTERAGVSEASSSGCSLTEVATTRAGV